MEPALLWLGKPKDAHKPFCAHSTPIPGRSTSQNPRSKPPEKSASKPDLADGSKFGEFRKDGADAADDGFVGMKTNFAVLFSPNETNG
jgi:hypothetical protein